MSSPQPLTGRMANVCMECGDTYSHTLCPPDQDGKQSHGYCAACFPSVMDRIEREEKKRFDDLEPGETEFQRGPEAREDTRRIELERWRNS